VKLVQFCHEEEQVRCAGKEERGRELKTTYVVGKVGECGVYGYRLKDIQRSTENKAVN
jgi:hypothetical protein